MNALNVQKWHNGHKHSNVEAVVLKLAAQNDLQSLKQQCLGPGLIYSVWAGTVLRKVRPVMPTCVGVDPLLYR